MQATEKNVEVDKNWIIYKKGNKIGIQGLNFERKEGREIWIKD